MEDDDASLILQFENAVMDTIQDDKALATFFVSYQAARKRLLEKTRSRGFWPPRPFKGGKKGKGKGIKGKSKGLPRRLPIPRAVCAANRDIGKQSAPTRKHP